MHSCVGDVSMGARRIAGGVNERGAWRGSLEGTAAFQSVQSKVFAEGVLG
jgi:hypothetical protein